MLAWVYCSNTVIASAEPGFSVGTYTFKKKTFYPCLNFFGIELKHGIPFLWRPRVKLSKCSRTRFAFYRAEPCRNTNLNFGSGIAEKQASWLAYLYFSGVRFRDSSTNALHLCSQSYPRWLLESWIYPYTPERPCFHSNCFGDPRWTLHGLAKTLPLFPLLVAVVSAQLAHGRGTDMGCFGCYWVRYGAGAQKGLFTLMFEFVISHFLVTHDSWS